MSRAHAIIRIKITWALGRCIILNKAIIELYLPKKSPIFILDKVFKYMMSGSDHDSG